MIALHRRHNDSWLRRREGMRQAVRRTVNLMLFRRIQFGYTLRLFGVGFALLAASAVAACAPAASKPSIEHMLATAQTASDHEAIAQYYEQEAADDEAKYEEHEAAASRYEHSPKFGIISAQHCHHLAQDYKQANQDASVLAAHRRVAEEMNSGTAMSAAGSPTDRSQ